MKELEAPLDRTRAARVLRHRAPLLRKACELRELLDAAQVKRDAHIHEVLHLTLASADATSEPLAGRFMHEHTLEMVERVAPFCDFCGAHELLLVMVSWPQCHASVRAARCIEGLADGTFEVEWGEAALEAVRGGVGLEATPWLPTVST